jgi:phosphohistidine phosphatase
MDCFGIQAGPRVWLVLFQHGKVRGEGLCCDFARRQAGRLHSRMYLYLVRHAIAFDPDPAQWPDDRDRPLTPDGEKRFRRAARGLRELVPSVDVVLSSPLLRAWQTAAILSGKAGWPEAQRFDALEPGTPPVEIVDALQPHASVSSLALVGHEPSLHELAAYLLCGDAATPQLVMRKGGVASLVFDDAPRAGGGSLDWLVRPGILRQL